MPPHIKVCGVTNVEDALMCLDEGVSAIGLNFVPSSARLIDVERAREIADAVGKRALVVGVVADMGVGEMLTLRDRASLGCLQLHGSEPPTALSPLLPHAYKALRSTHVARASEYGGAHLLVDGPSPGSGIPFDWSTVAALATRRKLTIAGGLHAGNVAEAMRQANPWCVDVATGVEVAGYPRRKDAARVHAFVTAVKAC